MYQVLIEKPARKQLEKLPPQIYEMLVAAIAALSDNPRPSGCKKLTGRNAYRIRVGDYRIIYTIDDGQLVVIVLAVGHRKHIYE